MIIKNKLDKSFGPAGSAAGLLLFIVGLVTIYFSNIGLVLFLLGAFLAFTYTGTSFDTDKKRIKNTEYVFGLVAHGKWIDIEPDMMLGISKQSTGFQVLSRSNKSLDLIQKDFRIVLYDEFQEKIMDINKFSTLELAEKDLAHFSLLLNIGIRPQNEIL